ncbi:hypothetical protein PG985_007024 [Apiospora marii]|uniref:Uncharacterized protein n=1 Tax=Apiospora marii TaxID=335849 RepID=A0ABR1SFP1_9PEZI
MQISRRSPEAMECNRILRLASSTGSARDPLASSSHRCYVLNSVTADIRVLGLDHLELVKELAALAVEKLRDLPLVLGVHLPQALDVEGARLEDGLDDVAVRLLEEDRRVLSRAGVAVASGAGVDHERVPVGLLLLGPLRAVDHGQPVEPPGELPPGGGIARVAQVLLLLLLDLGAISLVGVDARQGVGVV